MFNHYANPKGRKSLVHAFVLSFVFLFSMSQGLAQITIIIGTPNHTDEVYSQVENSDGNEVAPGISVYPVPFSESLNIERDGDLVIQSLTIVNISGQTVFSASGGDLNGDFPMPSLETGVYYLYIQSSQGTHAFNLEKI